MSESLKFSADDELNLAIRADLGQDKEIFSTILPDLQRQYAGLVCSIFRRNGGPESEVDDFKQEFWLRVFLHRKEYDPQLPLAPWIARLARNFAIDYKRKHRRWHAAASFDFDVVDEASGGVSDRMEVEELSALLRANVASLSDELRPAIELFLSDHPYKDIAERLGIPIGTVKSRIAAAKNRLSRTMRSAS